jgi:cell division septation protein DedD
MKLRWMALILLALALVIGCSEDSKKEAAKLEQEMKGEKAVTDTTATAVEDTMSESAQPMEPGAVPKEEKEEAYTGSQPEGSGYTVQVASCESMTYAQHLIKVYTERGYEPYMSKADVDGQTYYRVRIGIFPSLNEAQNLKSELADRYSVKAWIDYNG